MNTYDKVYADCQAGGMNNTDSDEVATEQAARGTYDEILRAIMEAPSFERLREINTLIVDVFMADEISVDQVALLRKSIAVREDAIATLATI